MKKVILFMLVGWVVCHEGLPQTTYYVDATSGSDTNNGTSTSTPWKTLGKVSSVSFSAGDQVKFKAGETFTGLLTISSSGSSGNPITYDMYGTGDLPILDGQGDTAAVYSYNKEYLEFKNLKITNHRSGTITSSDRFNGMFFVSEDYGTVDHLHFDNVTVYDVNSSDDESVSVTRYYGGILFYAAGDSLKSNFNDILIENCTFDDLSRTGVNIRSEWWYRNSDTSFGDDLGNGTLDNWYASTNVIVRDNTFNYIKGNGLIVRVTDKALVEGNLFDSCAYELSGNAAFCFNTDSTVFQYNEAKNTIYNTGDTDARGIDSDYRTKNTIVQYNYLHDNGKGGFVATGGPESGGVPERFNIGTVVRYNILENNDQQGMHFSGAIDSLEVYNNIVYADNTHDNIVILNFKKWTAWPNNVNFRNNIFHFTGDDPSFVYNDGGTGGATNLSFSNNIYFGTYPDKIPISANGSTLSNVTKDNAYSLDDPLFSKSDAGENNYLIREGSYAEGKGNNFAQPTADYYGNSVNTSSVNIGVFQGDLTPDFTTYMDTIYVSEDAYTRAGTYANTNYGSSSTVEVKKATDNYTRKGLLKFDLASIEGGIKKATLRIYASSNTSNSYDNFFYGLNDDSWSESTVTENNRPGSGSNPYFSTVTINSSASKWYDVDFTSFVQQQQLVDSVVSVLITDRNSSQYLTSITSKEGSASDKSYIVVEHYGSSVLRGDVLEDAYTRDGIYANNNYGNENKIETKTSSTNYNRKGMVKFDISNYQDSILTAKLHFYANTNTSNSFEHYVTGYGNNWSESTITENNRPALKDTITSVTLSGTTDKWYSVDVKAFVQEQKDNSYSRVSFAFSDEDASTYLSRVTSKEGNALFAAFLEVESIEKNPSARTGNKSVQGTEVAVEDLEEDRLSMFVYPNPIQSSFTIRKKFETSDMLVISVTSMEGRKIAQFVEEVRDGVWERNFSRNKLQLKTGIYSIKVSSAKHGDFSSKILVH